ncbi:membrane protein YdbS with pleckstrin-like domain [Bacillus ectoiniformans]|uniref:PH domain-containing protein n=1 Tax=Bacillus ectoiniformans TaxID=1494429 RepID=UPI0019582677|nr:PH domain-containing protein [Bacillus ectoiniformans]MBM7649402.1 membrane protein YdbS with pleckstrin-like domain [Bacillus ectoiniformans]
MTEPKNRISPNGLKVWRIHGLLTSLVVWLLAAGAGVLIYIKEWPSWWIAIIVFAAVSELIIFVFWMPRLRWKRWRYEVREQEIELQQGVFITRRTLIPMVRVQHVDTEQGPILRKYSLAIIKISTAATIHEIPAIDLAEAEEMRQKISMLARVAEEDV